MRIRVLLYLSVLSIAGVALADPKIEADAYVWNKRPGWCVWASAEILGRHHKIKSMHGLTTRYMEAFPDGGSTLQDARVALTALGVKHSYTERPDPEFLRDACKRDLGAVVALDHWPKLFTYHAVAVYSFDDSDVGWIDSNDPRSRWTAKRVWFDKHWTSWAIVIEP